MTVRTYDPKKIVITIGPHIVTGYAEDEFISIEPVGDGTTSMSGADGEVVRSLSNDGRHTITLTVQAQSPTNTYLSNLMRLDRASGGRGIVPFMLRDLLGTSLFAASQCWVVNTPTQGFGAQATEREWALEAVATDIFVGGSLL